VRLGFDFRLARPLQGMCGDVETRRCLNDTPDFDVSGGSKSTVSEARTEDVSDTLTETGKYGNVWFSILCLIVVFRIFGDLWSEFELVFEIMNSDLVLKLRKYHTNYGNYQTIRNGMIKMINGR